jgi:L-lactate utilization protein LutB
MDDTTSRKCRLIRNEVLANLDKYEIMLDNPWYRNGVMIYKNKTNQ